MLITITLLSLHLIGVGLIVGAVILSLLISYQSNLDLSALKNFKLIRLTGSLGAGLAIVTGVIMAWRLGVPLKNNPLFVTKLALVAVDGLIAQLVIRRWLDNSDNGQAIKNLRGWAWLSVVIVVLIVVISVTRAKL